MEYGRGQGGVGAAFREYAAEVLRFAGASGGNNRNMRRVRDGRGKRTIETGLHAVRIHGGQQDLARAERLAVAGPLDGIDAFIIATAARVHVPPARTVGARIDGQHYSLRAELFAQ